MEVIKVIKELMQEVILENKLKEYTNVPIEDLFRIYSADFCSILLTYFPWATIMINKKNYLECALLISGYVYNCTGVITNDDYAIANAEEIGMITRGFKHISSFTLGKLLDKLNNNLKAVNSVYTLRKDDKHFL